MSNSPPTRRQLWIAAGLTGAWLIPRNTPHKSVAHYIERANATGTAFAKQYQHVGNAYRSLTLAPQAQAARGCRQWHYSLDFNEKCGSVDYVLEFLRKVAHADLRAELP